VAKYRIAWMPGDGIGHDVLEAAKIVLDAIDLDAEYVPAEVGWTCWEKYRDALPPGTIEILKECDCGLFGAITSRPNVPGYRSPIVRMRILFDLYVNLRPCKAFPGNPLNYRDDIDLVIFRENTEGLYSGIEYRPIPDEIMKLPGMRQVDPNEAAISIRLFTKKGCRRIVKAAFEYAKKHGRKKVTAVHKANVVRETCGMFLEEAREVAAEYPDIAFEEQNVDAVAMWLIKNPQDYDILVTTNLFGDIISDEAAQLIGSLGFGSSGNIGDDFAVFEPTHGSAPKYAGQYKVNPMATLLATRLMFEWLGEEEKARRLEDALSRVIREGKVKTYDMGGSSTTLEVAEEVARVLG